jgi:hypothetical protein
VKNRREQVFGPVAEPRWITTSAIPGRVDGAGTIFINADEKNRADLDMARSR